MWKESEGSCAGENCIMIFSVKGTDKWDTGGCCMPTSLKTRFLKSQPSAQRWPDLPVDLMTDLWRRALGPWTTWVTKGGKGRFVRVGLSFKSKVIHESIQQNLMLISTLASNMQPVGSNTAIKLAERIEKNSCWTRVAVIVFIRKHHF